MSVRNFIELNGLWTQELHFASVTHSDKLGPEIDSKSSHRMSRGPQWLVLRFEVESSENFLRAKNRPSVFPSSYLGTADSR